MRPKSKTSLMIALASAVLGYEVKTPPLDTEWTYRVGTNPWQQYPRPLLRRQEWQSLNGVWKWRAAEALDDERMPPVNETLHQDVLVPSCLESGLSGIMKSDAVYSWFATEFTVPVEWSRPNRRLMLNFEAVDYMSTVYVNGARVGSHSGGYWHFKIDVTDFVNPIGSNRLYGCGVPRVVNCDTLANITRGSHVFVFDPTDALPEWNIPHGKQSRTPEHITYTACTGIWQSVWLEPVPNSHIAEIHVAADMDGQVAMTVFSSGSPEPVSVSVINTAGEVVASHSSSSNEPFKFTVDSPTLWSPATPALYDLTVKLGDDEVASYTGFRTISVGEVNGIRRPLLNGQFVFQFGTLDQGYWPDGLYTPPSREAMIYDLEVLKRLGFNMIRKHVKVEPALFYQACDQLGLLVIQDMPSLKSHDIVPTTEELEEFERQVVLLVNQHRNYPSIATWVIFNEGWGQPLTPQTEFNIVAHVKALDPTRLVDATSGWQDHGAGDWHDNHHYANPQCGTPFYSTRSTPYDPTRLALQGEFGGIGHNVSEKHLWKVQKAIDTINQTYELDSDLEAYNYRGHLLMAELREQVEKYSCSAAVWTQTTDVEGEVNGFLTYDRRILRTYEVQWKADIQALYDAAGKRRLHGDLATELTMQI